MRTAPRPYFLLLVFASVLTLAGCSDSSGGKMEITGTVNLVGKPIEDGMIMFKPLESQTTTQGAQIRHGEYKIPKKQGLLPGKYLVQISSGDGETPVNAGEDFAPGPSRNFVSVDKVPEDWNIKSKQEVTVKSEPPNKFDFNIPNYNTPKTKGGKKK